MVLQGLKLRIFDNLNRHDNKWAAELPSVLWSLRTTPSQAMGFTPFFLVYGSEAMPPTDVEYGSPRLKAYNEQNNDATREDALDQLKEARDMALLHSTKYQESLQRYHDKHIHRRNLNVGDLVLWQSQNNKGRHKLTPPWKEPYIITEVLKPDTYKLSNEKGKIFTNAWNIEQLRRFFRKASRLYKLFHNPMIE
jgi:hypothetical protein